MIKSIMKNVQKESEVNKMEFNEICQLIISNGMGIGVAVYFLFKDWKQSEQRIEADNARAKADAAQTEVMRQLCETINALKETVERMGE